MDNKITYKGAKMLSKEVVKKLNDQINKEMFSANLYLSMSSWCYSNGYDGAGDFFFFFSDEESAHAKKSCKDYATFNFLQWYVSEQHEEEALFRSIVDKLKMVSDSGNGPYLADQYIKGLLSK